MRDESNCADWFPAPPGWRVKRAWLVSRYESSLQVHVQSCTCSCKVCSYAPFSSASCTTAQVSGYLSCWSFSFFSLPAYNIFPRSTMDADVVAVSPSSPVSPGSKQCQNLRWPKTWCCFVRWWGGGHIHPFGFIRPRVQGKSTNTTNFAFMKWNNSLHVSSVSASRFNSRSLSLEVAASCSAKFARKQTSSLSPMVSSLPARNRMWPASSSTSLVTYMCNRPRLFHTRGEQAEQ